MKTFKEFAENRDISETNAGPGGSIENHIYESKEEAMKEAKEYGLSGVHVHPFKDGTPGWMPGKDMEEFEEWFKSKGKNKEDE
jgi:hypothetical protein